MSEKKFYVYVHRYASGPKEGRVFYVGKGSGRRAQRRKREYNPYWQRIADKYGFYVEFVFSSDIEACAFSIEAALIKHYGKSNLTNITDGGDGSSGGGEWLKKKVCCSNGMTFESAIDASYWIASQGIGKGCRASISNACNGKTKSAYGFNWWFLGEPPKSHKVKSMKGKPVYCSNGMSFNNASSAVIALKENGFPISLSNLNAALSGKLKTCCGFSWSHNKGKIPKFIQPNNLPKSIVCSNGMKFDSYTDAVKWLSNNGHPNACRSPIRYVCQGRRRKAYGFGWSFT